MGFNIGVDSMILLIIAILVTCYFIYHASRIYQVYSRKKFLAWAVLRGVVLICLIMVAAGFKMALAGGGATTIFLVDRSLSMGDKAGEIEDWINRQISDHKGRRDKVGVVSFARDPMIELPVTGDTKEVKLAAAPDPNFTNVQKALEFSRNCFPRDTQKRLVLITDGQENMGEAEATLRSLGGMGINLAVYPVPAPATKDVRIAEMRVPSYVHTGEKIPIEVELSSNIETEGILRILNGQHKVWEEKVRVTRGSNTFNCQVTVDSDSEVDFRGEISFAGDQNPRNDIFTVTVPVKGSPKVMVIGEKVETENIERLLESVGVGHQSYRPEEVKGEPGFLSRFEEIIIANVPHQDLPAGFETALEKCVEEQGIGLIVVGGDRSFAPGGYEKTIMEKILPVRCRMKGNEKLPNTGLVLAVDCSGSMNDESGGVKKLEMVKEAAVKSLEALEKEDRLGVLAFSDVQEWVVPVCSLTQKEKVKNEIGKLKPKGGTLILPALEQAAEALERENVKVKHIILLTDGQAEKKGYEEIISRLKARGITLSTVAVGKDADRKLLDTLGKQGNGRSYYTEYFQDVPAIFAKETYLATKKYLNNRRFVPRQIEGSGFPAVAALPGLYGYTGTGIKDRAVSVLESDSNDPVLAFWQYGLGNVAVWTSDLNGKWSREWIEWGGFPNYWGMVVNKCLGTACEDLDISISRSGCSLSISVGVSGCKGGESLVMTAFAPDGKEKEIALVQKRPGVFEGKLDLDQTGSYALDFKLKKDGKILKHARRTVHLDYSPEYATDQQQEKAHLIGAFGNIIDSETDVFDLPLEKESRDARSMEHLLLPLALVAFIGEIWVRKMM